MWKFFSLSVLLIYCNLLSFSQEEYIEATIARNNAFSFKYFSLLNKPAENTVISPFGASCLMAMAYIGSEGNTQTEIARSMNFITPYGILFSYKQLIKRYQTSKSNDVDLFIGNAFWNNSEILVQKKYKNLLKVNFGAHVEDLQFLNDDENNLKTINRWVKKSSNYNILNIVGTHDIDAESNLVYTNYFFLNGNWDNPFDEQFTRKDDFVKSDSSKIKVDFMSQTSYLKYNENEVFQILEMPYSTGNLSLVLIMPKQDYNLDSIYASFNAFNFNFWTNELYLKLVNLSIPKFRIESTTELSPLLVSDGCKLPFSAMADFSRITDKKTHISSLIQKTVISIEENKNKNLTEQVISEDKSFLNKDNTFVSFKANKPFIFVIKDNLNSNILALGKVILPTYENLSVDFNNN
ncbi:MAG: serpin family protein [Bacteroidales bacterium]